MGILAGPREQPRTVHDTAITRAKAMMASPARSQILTHSRQPLEPPPASPARGPPTDWGELVQLHDDRDGGAPGEDRQARVVGCLPLARPKQDLLRKDPAAVAGRSAGWLPYQLAQLGRQARPEPGMGFDQPDDVGEIPGLLALPTRGLRPSLHVPRQRVVQRCHANEDAMHVGRHGSAGKLTGKVFVRKLDRDRRAAFQIHRPVESAAPGSVPPMGTREAVSGRQRPGRWRDMVGSERRFRSRVPARGFRPRVARQQGGRCGSAIDRAMLFSQRGGLVACRPARRRCSRRSKIFSGSTTCRP